MTTTPEQPEESPVLTELTAMYRDGMEPPTAAELNRGLDTLLARVGSARSRRWATVRWPLVGAAAALAIVAVVGVRSLVRKSGPAPDTLTYRMSGGVVVEGGYLREAGHSGMKLAFNEGSQLVLDSGTRGRLGAVDSGGAHIAIEHGKASFQITPSNSRRWLVEVGPFLVTVKGTRFTLSWDPLSEEFDLTLQNGRVVVSGPVPAGEMALRAGQHLAVNLAKAETVIREDPLDEPSAVVVPPPAVAPDVRPPIGDTAATPSASASFAPSSTRSASDRHWGDELARGHWDRILDEARRSGVESVLRSASGDDLFALADAARYRRQSGLARAALLAERKRFPTSPRALDTLFLLGRVEELDENRTKQAIAWYDQYLTSAPSGPFVGEALGRKMSLTDRLAGPVRARPVAAEYLRRFPDGSYAGLARELIRAP